jgi:hypothetical protein
MKRIPEMISGDWRPTPDPTGRKVRLTTLLGEEMQGTVVAVEYEEDREPTLYIDVASPDEHRGERGASASRITWLDPDQPPWSESDTPSGRWVLFQDENGVERAGCVVTVDSRHSSDAVLLVLQINGPEGLDTVEVPWQEVKWLPE